MARSFFIRTSSVILLVLANIALGTAWHEVLGHGFVGAACGGRVTEIVVLGVRLWPDRAWTGSVGAFGSCDVVGVRAGLCEHLWLLTGSLSTFAVSASAVLLLQLRKWKPPARLVLFGLSLWWIDLLTYTLPSLGLRRYLLFGRRHAEPFDAAVAMGIPGWLFQLLTFGVCLLLAVLTIQAFRRSLSMTRGFQAA